MTTPIPPDVPKGPTPPSRPAGSSEARGVPPRAKPTAPSSTAPQGGPRPTPVGAPAPRAESPLLGIVALVLVLATLGVGGWLFVLLLKPVGPEETAESTEEVAEVSPSPVAQSYEHPEGFRLTPPLGWVVDQEVPRGTLASFSSGTGDGTADGSAAATITVTRSALRAGTTLDTFITQVAGDLSRTYRGYTAIDDAPVTTAAGVPGRIVGGTYTDAGTTVRLKRLVLVLDARGYLVTGTAPASAWDAGNYNALFDAALTSFALVERPNPSASPTPGS